MSKYFDAICDFADLWLERAAAAAKHIIKLTTNRAVKVR